MPVDADEVNMDQLVESTMGYSGAEVSSEFLDIKLQT